MRIGILGICVLLVGCGNSGSTFAAAQDNKVGRIYHSSPYEIPTRRAPDGKGGEVLFFRKGECSYRLFLNSERVVTRWEYLSNPENCKIEIDWSAPW